MARHAQLEHLQGGWLMNVGKSITASSVLGGAAAFCRRRLMQAACLAALYLLNGSQVYGQGAPGIGAVPSAGYFAGLGPFYDGDFNAAENIFGGMAQGAIKNPLAAAA